MDEIKPVAGKDYPATWSEFRDWFASDDVCAAYLEQLRWPNGFYCPTCGIPDTPGRATRGRLICRACRHQCSVTAGTIFDKTRTPLHVWFAAAWYLTSQKQGVSALGLQRVLGLSSYQTAWGHAAPVSACDGAPRPGLAERDGGDRRNVPGAATRSPRGRQRCALQDTQQSSLGCRRGGG